MAEVSNRHRLIYAPPPCRIPVSTTTSSSSQQEGIGLQDGFYYQRSPSFFDYDSFSPHNPSIPTFLDDYTTSFGFGFDTSSETDDPGSENEDPDCFFFGSDEDAEQMNFVTDLFESRETNVTEDPSSEFDSERVDNSGLEFGFGPGLGSNAGFREAGMDSEPDSDEIVVNAGFINDDENYDNFEANNDEYYSANEMEEFEWEEVSERNHFDEREILNSVINRIEEISVSSEISSSEIENSSLGDDEEEEEERRNRIDWEVLLAMNELESNFERENSLETVESEIQRGNVPEDYIMALEYDTLFGQLVENENALKCYRPAAKSVVENLPLVVLTKDEVEENNGTVACAICMEEFPTGAKLTRMPCFHMYHVECILPWLRSRNTCPVCRYELPTDDADYEKWRCERRGGELAAHLVDTF